MDCLKNVEGAERERGTSRLGADWGGVLTHNLACIYQTAKLASGFVQMRLSPELIRWGGSDKVEKVAVRERG